MKRKIEKLFTFFLMITFSLAFKSQAVGINTTDPKGILHLKNTDKQLGLVMPIVESAETATATDGTTPVEATVVYDNTQKCLRLKKSTTFTDCLLDKSSINSIISTSINGSNYWYGPETTNLSKQLFSCSGSLYATIYADASDSNFLAGAGYGTYVGTGTTTNITPSQRLLSKEIVSVSGSIESYMAVDSSGNLWATGSNLTHKFGNDSALSTTVWTKIDTSQIPQGEKIIQVKVAYYATILLTDKGNVYSAGYNPYGQTGLGTIVGDTNKFTKIPTLSNITSIWGGDSYEPLVMFTAISNSGEIFAWGYNLSAGPWGNTTTVISTPTNITPFFASATANGAKIEKVIINKTIVMALSSDKKLWGSVATANLMPYIGLGNTLSTTSDLRNIFTGQLDSDEYIVDFDNDMYGSVFITNKSLWFTGINYQNRFGTAAVNTYVWTKAPDPIFDGKIRLTGIDLSYYKTLIQTSSKVSEGGGRFITAGYNLYNNISSSSSLNITPFSFNAR